MITRRKLILALFWLAVLALDPPRLSAQCQFTYQFYPFLQKVEPVIGYQNRIEWSATFGYVNTGTETCEVKRGGYNFTWPGSINRGQPTMLEPGIHYDAFTATSPFVIHWQLGGYVYTPDYSITLQPEPTVDVSAAMLRVNKAGVDRLLVTPDHFIAHAPGGAVIYSNPERTIGAILHPSAGSWSVTSDINRKRDFIEVDGEGVLERLARLRIGTWSYKSQDPSIRHMGPSAQEFRAAFGLGESDTTISTVDAAGVALAAFQALERRTADLEARIAALEARVSGQQDVIVPPGPLPAVNNAPERAQVDVARETIADTMLLDVSTRGGEQRFVVTDQTLTITAPAGAAFYGRADRLLGVLLPAGSGSWALTSDSAKKTSFENIDQARFTAALRALRIGTWSYDVRGPAARHMGPSAQGFRNAFGLDASDYSISEVDALGVNLYGAQLIGERVGHLARRIEQLAGDQRWK